MGQSPKGEFVNEEGDGMPFYQGKAEFGKHNPKPRKSCTKPTKVVESGDILLSVRAPVGPTNICQETSCVGRGLAGIRSRIPESQRYLHYYFKNIEPWLSQQGTGTTFKAVSGGFLRELEVPVPPLAEQTRIANKLDELLAQVDTIKARVDAIPGILKRFRQSVLAAAVSGRLTEEWRGTPDLIGWKQKTLLDVIVSKPRNGHSPKGVEYETKYRNLTLSATTPGYFVPNKFKYIDIDIPDDSHLWVKNGDILIQRANSLEYVGVSALYMGVDNEYVYPDLMMKCRPNEQIVPEYLHYCLMSCQVRKYFRDNATGTAGNMPKINQKVVSCAPIMLPSIEEQKSIVAVVEKLKRFSDLVVKRADSARGRSNDLTQSILAKAFRGELVPQNPDDEPASVLLERIRGGSR